MCVSSRKCVSTVLVLVRWYGDGEILQVLGAAPNLISRRCERHRRCPERMAPDRPVGDIDEAEEILSLGRIAPIAKVLAGRQNAPISAR